MKRRKPRLRRRNSRAEQKVRDAMAHLLRCFVGESYRQNGFGGHPIGAQAGHSIGDRPRLACSRACKNQQGAFDGFHSKSLFRIQFVEKSEHWPAMIGESLHTSW